MMEFIAMHTPGPWRLDEYKGGRRIVVDGNPPIPIQIFYHHGNALLCAAAPDLLKALEDLVRLVQTEYENPRNVVSGQQLRALEAIAKAKGPTKPWARNVEPR